MQKTAITAMVFVLAFLGIADAWYLADSALRGAELSCNIAGLDGCNIVAASEYARFLGVPLAVYGVVFYAVIFVLSALALLMPHKRLYVALLVFGVIGFATSAYFMLLQIMVINATCVYCAVSALISALIGALTWRLFQLSRNAPRVTMAL